MKLLNDLPAAHLLTAAQEASLCKRDKTKLVLHTMREAFVYARRCCRGGLPDDDIYSLCYMALTSAARRYKPAKGRFFAYAKIFVRGQVSRAWKRLDVVKHSSMNESSELISETKHVLVDGSFLGAAHTQEEAEIDVPNRPGERATDPEFDLIDIHERIAIIEPILRAKLTPREQQIIELRYKSGFNFTKIGEMFGVSRQAAEMVHGKALQKVRKELARKSQL